MISYGTDNGNFPFVLLQHANGATVKIYEYGAQIVSWKLSDKTEIFFMSPGAIFESGKAIRGGVPIVFPQFNKGKLPAHGFGRISHWTPVKQFISSGGDLSVTFRLGSSAIDLQLWPHAFRAELEVILSDNLQFTLSVENRGIEEFQFQNAFHSYFRVTDIDNVHIEGLAAHSFIDFLQERKTSEEKRDEVKIFEAIDRCYTGVLEEVALIDTGLSRKVRIINDGMSDIVVWNPWSEGEKKISDLPPNSFRSFVCVEGGNIESPLTVEPGRFVACRQRLVVESI